MWPLGLGQIQTSVYAGGIASERIRASSLASRRIGISVPRAVVDNAAPTIKPESTKPDAWMSYLYNPVRAGNLVAIDGKEAQVLFAGTASGLVAGVIRVDVRLPGISGLEFQKELAKAGTDMPIIFLTGHGDIPMGVQAMKAGAVEFLTKPCRDQDLLNSVRLALARDQEKREGAKYLASLKADFAHSASSLSHDRMSALGHKRTLRHASGMSVSPPRADMLSVGIDVR
jgi:ActR/RegA family two-component response regulator